MDIRFIILNYVWSEMWGHRGRKRTRESKDRAKRRSRAAGKSAAQGKGVTGSEPIVAKPRMQLSRKAAIAPYIPVP